MKIVKTVEDIFELANNRKSVVITRRSGKLHPIPAAIVQNWQLRYVYNLIKKGSISVYDKNAKKVKLEDIF